jgi:hypothetical protein
MTTPLMLSDLRAAAALSAAAYLHSATHMDECISPFGWRVHDDIQRDSNRVLICFNDILSVAAIVFRGSANRQNWLENLDARLYRAEDGGSTHYGFTEEYLALHAEVQERFNLLMEDRRYPSLLVTGHSLGGALACLCAYRLRTALPSPELRVITFGQPRVGTMYWQSMYNACIPNTLRVVHAYDDVPLLPGVPFHHVGTLLHLDSQGREISAPGRWCVAMLQWIRGVFRYPKAGVLDHLLPSYITTINKMSPTWSTK